MLGHGNDRREGVCEGTDVYEGPAAFQGTEDSGWTAEHLRVEWWQVQGELHRLGCNFFGGFGESEKSGLGEHLPRFALETGQE